MTDANGRKYILNFQMIRHVIGQISRVEAALLILPLLVSLAYGEKTSAIAFLFTIAIAITFGTLLMQKKPQNVVIYAREGFLIVAFSWIVLSVFGALPFVFSGEIPHFIDAFFETVSGFTTTGSSILTNVEALSHGMLFWRSFTHWVGGMGVLVFALAILPLADDRSIHILRAEAPGPTVGKLMPRMKDTAKVLYLIYLVMTVVLILLLWLGGMSLFDSFVHAFGTAGTGGFGIKSASIGYYNSAYIDWVITIFMMLFGVNFNLYYFMLLRRWKDAFFNSELIAYWGIIIGSVALISINIRGYFNSIADTVRYAAFQVSTIITTTGFATTDFNLWPSFSKAILVLLMFIGACAGSTGGGIKVSRLLLMGKMVKKETRRMIHPRAVSLIKMDGKVVSEDTLSGVTAYMVTYLAIMCVSVLLLSIDGFDLESTATAMIACLNNIGPGLGMVGPTGSFAGFSAFSKLVLSFDMLFGRLEIFPMLMLFSPSVWNWRKKF